MFLNAPTLNTSHYIDPTGILCNSILKESNPKEYVAPTTIFASKMMPDE